MDGNGITELHTTNQSAYGLDLCHSTQTLYWASDDYDGVWKMSVNGSHLRVMQLNYNFTAFALWDNGIYSIDGFSGTTLMEPLCSHELYSKLAIIIAGTQQSGTLDTLTSAFLFFQLISVSTCYTITDSYSQWCPEYHYVVPSSSTSPNPCDDDNGGCSKLCLLSAVDPRGYTCADEGISIVEAL